MSCENCPTTHPIPQCIDTLVVGNVLTLESVYVYFKNTATGRIDMYEATPDTGGDVSIAGPELAINTSYKVWIQEQAATDQSEGVTISLDSSGVPTDVECYTVRFLNPNTQIYPLIEIVL